MKILLTNDDGIFAEGIHALWKELKKFSDVTVVAPDGERSSIGHAITLSHPLRCQKVKRNQKPFGTAVTGTPADCVKLGVEVILKKKPDLVVSGINFGDNDGCSVFYSGTVAGAREGALMGIPAMAISLANFTDPQFSEAAKIGAKLCKKITKEGLPSGTFLNVNVPQLGHGKIKGIKYCRQGLNPIHGQFHHRKDQFQRDYYWLSGKAPHYSDDMTSDTVALKQGFVTITPIHCDMTDYGTLKTLKTWKI